MGITDAQIVTILDRTAAIADPILDVLAHTDPFDLKPRTFGRSWWELIPTSLGDLTATAMNVADWPGTGGWEKLSMNERADWWVNRIGALNTVAVAFPGVLGPWAKTLPVGAFLGAASQALMVMAVGREYGVVDRDDQIAMLGAVIFGRELSGTDARHAERRSFPESGTELAKAVVKALWDIGTGLRNVEKALGARPKSPSLIGHLTWLPLVGAPATYLGERIALCRAVEASRRWIIDHREAIEV